MYCQHFPPNLRRQALEDPGLHLRQSSMCNVGVSAPWPIDYSKRIAEALKVSVNISTSGGGDRHRHHLQLRRRSAPSLSGNFESSTLQ